MIKEMILKSNATNIFQDTIQLTCYYKGKEVMPQWSVDGDAAIDANGLLTFNSEGEVTVKAIYNGVSENILCKYVTHLTEVEGDSTIIIVPVRGGNQITWGETSGNYGQIRLYQEDGTYIDFFNPSGSSRTITTPVNCAIVKASFVTANLDNSFIKDATTGKYLWKGKNVE